MKASQPVTAAALKLAPHVLMRPHEDSRAADRSALLAGGRNLEGSARINGSSQSDADKPRKHRIAAAQIYKNITFLESFS